jgi:transcriptional regulator with XRE-family HTH domain
LPFCRVSLKAPWQPATYPKEFKHLGDHIRKRRLDLGLTQEEAADRTGASDRWAVNRWELGLHEPGVSVLPGILEFLGYDPRPEPTSMAEWLVWHRTGRGRSQERMARQLGVTSRTLGRWETGKREVLGKYLAKVQAVLGQKER